MELYTPLDLTRLQTPTLRRASAPTLTDTYIHTFNISCHTFCTHVRSEPCGDFPPFQSPYLPKFFVVSRMRLGRCSEVMVGGRGRSNGMIEDIASRV